MPTPLPITTGGDRTPEELEQFGNLLLPNTGLDSVQAAWQLGFRDTLSNALSRGSDLNTAIKDEDSPIISAAEANRRAPDLEEPFTKDVPESYFNLVVEANAERRRLRQRIQQGPQGGIYTVMNFGAQMAASATDPLEIAAGVFTGGLFTIARLGKSAFKATNVIRVLKSSRSFNPQTFRQIMGENFVANAAIEPAILHANQLEKQDYDMVDSLVNITAGALVGSGFQFAAGKISRALTYESPTRRIMNFRNAMAQAAQDHKIDMQHMVRQRAREISGEMRGKNKFGALNEEYVPLNVDANLKGKILFHTSSTKSNSVFDSDHLSAPRDTDLGIGVQAFESFNRAHGLADDGVIHQIELIDDVRLADIEQRFEPGVAGDIRAAFDGRISKAELDAALRENGRAVYNLIKNKIDIGRMDRTDLDEINKILKENGFDGIRYESRNYMDENIDKQNGILLFGGDKIRQKSVISPDPTLKPSITDKQRQEIAEVRQNRENLYDFNKAESDEFDDLASAQPDFIDADARREIDELDEQVDSLKEQGILSREEIERLDNERAIEKVEDQNIKIARMAEFCARSNK